MKTLNNLPLYKFLNEDGTTAQGYGKWHLPKNGKPGKWMPKIAGELVACENGYHLCRQSTDLLEWCGAPALYRAEYRLEMVEADDKVVVRQARLLDRVETWNERTARLFACDCAEQAMKLIKEPDQRSIEAVYVARLYAVGQASQDELYAAAWAAWAAEWAVRSAALGAGAVRKWQFDRLMFYLNGEKDNA